MKTKRSAFPVWKRILRIFGALVLIVIVLFAALVLYLTQTEYYPKEDISLTASGNATETIQTNSSLHIMSWNIGYGALGDNADFFMVGGSHVMTASKERIHDNLFAIEEEIAKEHPDILLLQEVDRNSKRSHHVNELQEIASTLPDSEVTFASNFKVPFIPYPIPPMGKVDSGIATFSNIASSSSIRRPLPCPFQWPIRIANLKRCLMINRMEIENSDKELVVVNLHLEAYDNGEGKEAQTRALFDFLEEESEKGNYVIAGGDFNQLFSVTDSSRFPVREDCWQPGSIDLAPYLKDFTALMDDSVPSCRSLDQPLVGADLENFQYYIIDGFLVSNNIQVESFSAKDLGFRNSDHNPIVMDITLKE